MSVTFDEIVRQAYLENVDRGDMELLKVIEKVFYNASGDGGGDSEDYSGIAFFDNSATFSDVQAAISDDKLPILKFYIMGAPAYFYCCEHSTVWVDFVSFGGLVKYQLRWDNNGNKQLSSQTLVTNQSPHFYGNPTATTQDVNDSSTRLATTSFVNRAVNNAITDIAISGISEPIKQALLQLARKVAYIDDDGQTYYDALYNALYPPINVDSISAVWNPPQDYVVYTTTPIDTLKAYLTVTATYDDQTTAVLDADEYVLSGTLAAGTSVITVTYGNATTTFNVTVVANEVESIETTFTQGTAKIYDYDSLSDLVQYLTVTATYTNLNTVYVEYPDYTLSGTLTEGTSVITVSYAGKTDTFTVSVSIGLDSIAYGTKTYRDIFITGNLLPFGDFEPTLNITSSWVNWNNNSNKKYKANAGAPTQSTTECNSPTKSLKCFGSTAQQLNYADSTVHPTGEYICAMSVNIPRYVSGNGSGVAGIYVQAGVNLGQNSIMHQTDGFEEHVVILDVGSDTTNTFSIYVGSRGDSDAYVDDVVFTPLPSGMTLVEAQTLYEKYCAIRRAS